MVDLDPTIQDQSNKYEVIHWLVFNIPGNDVGKGTTHAEYIGPLPPKNTGKLCIDSLEMGFSLI